MQEDVGGGTPEEMSIVSFTTNLRACGRPAAVVADPQSDDTPPRPHRQLLEAGRVFGASLRVLWEYQNSVAAMAAETSARNVAELLGLINDLATRHQSARSDELPIAVLDVSFRLASEGTEKTANLSVDVFEQPHVEEIQRFREYKNAADRILRESAIQHIVNSYEQLLAQLLIETLSSAPSDGMKSRQIAYDKIIGFESFAEVRQYVVDCEISEFLRQTTAQQIKHFEAHYGINLGSSAPGLTSQLCEVVLRRHAIVHAGGIVTSEYIRRASKIQGLSIDKLREGDLVDLSSEYIELAWDVVYSVGTLLVYLIGKKLTRQWKDRDAEMDCDDFLNQSAYYAIQNRRYSAASNILSCGRQMRAAKESSGYRIDINYAQSMYWLGKTERCEEVLSEHEWEAASPEFQLAVAALRGDADRFQTLLKSTAAQRKVTPSELQQWPVYARIREHPNFQVWLVDVFGQDLLGIVKEGRAAVLSVAALAKASSIQLPPPADDDASPVGEDAEDTDSQGEGSAEDSSPRD